MNDLSDLATQDNLQEAPHRPTWLASPPTPPLDDTMPSPPNQKLAETPWDVTGGAPSSSLRTYPSEMTTKRVPVSPPPPPPPQTPSLVHSSMQASASMTAGASQRLNVTPPREGTSRSAKGRHAVHAPLTSAAEDHDTSQVSSRPARSGGGATNRSAAPPADLQQAGVTCAMPQAEKEGLAQAGCRYRGHTAQRGRQDEADDAELCAQNAAHTEELDSQAEEVERLRGEVRAAHTSLSALQRTCRQAEERAVLAEQAFEALRAAWTAASSHNRFCPTSSPVDDRGDRDSATPPEKATLLDTALAPLTEAVLLARLQEGQCAMTHLPPAAFTRHLSNGTALRRIQYQDAVTECYERDLAATARRDADTTELINTSCINLFTAWSTRSNTMCTQLERLSQRVAHLSTRLSLRRGSVHRAQQEQLAHEMALRAELTRHADQLAQVTHERQLLHAQVAGLEASLARLGEPSRLAPAMSEAADALRGAHTGLTRAVGKALARAEAITATDAGASLTDAFLVVVQNTAMKAEAQVELLARKLVQCAAASPDTAASTFRDNAGGGRHVAFSLEAERRTRSTASAATPRRYDSPRTGGEHGIVQSPATAWLDGDAESHPTAAVSDAYPPSLTTAHHRQVYAEMQRLLRAPPLTTLVDPFNSSTSTSARHGALQLLKPLDGVWDEYGESGSRHCLRGHDFCHAHHRELLALQHTVRQLRNMSVLLDNHSSQSRTQQERLVDALRDLDHSMRTAMADLATVMRTLLAEATGVQSTADRTADLVTRTWRLDGLSHGGGEGATQHTSAHPVALASAPRSPAHTDGVDEDVVAPCPNAKEARPRPLALCATASHTDHMKPPHAPGTSHGGRRELSPAAQRLATGELASRSLSADGALAAPAVSFESQPSPAAMTPTSHRNVSAEALKAALHGVPVTPRRNTDARSPHTEASGAVRFRH